LIKKIPAAIVFVQKNFSFQNERDKKNPTILSKKTCHDSVEKVKQISAVQHDPPSSTVVKPPQKPLLR